MFKNLKYYWQINLSVLLAAAVATAVLTGALLVGDSVRGSLRDLTLDRLGEIDYALVPQKYFREDLLLDLIQSNDFEKHFESIASAIILNGASINFESKSRASKINIIAIDEQFTPFHQSDTDEKNLLAFLHKSSGQVFPSIIINQTLQNQLKANIGDQILLSFEKPSDIARGSLLGHKDTEAVVETMRFTLTKIIPDRGIGRFSLTPHQILPMNAYVLLPVFQKTLEQNNDVNAIFVSQKSNAVENDLTLSLQNRLTPILNFEDLGLKIIENDSFFTLESEQSILSPQIVEWTNSVVGDLNAPALAIYTYLANSMQANDRLLPYSTVTAMNPTIGAPFGALKLTNGQPAPKLAADEILLNTWAANDLRVQVGETIEMSYFGVGSRDDLITKHTSFRLKGILAFNGLAADESLTPDFPGIADADNMSDWDPPFPVDLSLIRPKDEAYWDRYRATPKAFVSEETGKQLWGSRFGNLTSIRIGAAPDSDVFTTLDEFEQRILEKITPEKLGYIFQPLKKQSLASSAGATDFSGLFIGFSLFLIVSAAMLVGLLFRLGVEQRASEIGMLFSVGFPTRKVRMQFMKEGGLIAAIGAIIGLGGAIFYAWLMMVGLRTWWLTAVGTPFLFLHITPLSLELGYFISLVVILLSIWLGFRKLSKVPTPGLLAGVTSVLKKGRTGRLRRMVAFITLALAITLTGFAFAANVTSSAGLFFGIGTLVLISGLAFFSIWLHGKHKPISANQGIMTIARIAARNSPRNPGRSMLSAALVGCACFVIVAVEAFRQDFGAETLNKDTGAGGFSLIAEADIPLHYDLNTGNGRFELGFSDADSEILSQAKIYPFRLLPGEDTSCLNLYQVQKPRILGVTADEINRGGFRFKKTVKTQTNDQVNPWSLLEQDVEPDVIPAFGDDNSVTWILHSGLGNDIAITNEFGKEIKLRFVGLLQKSIFQSELLISEENFLKHFPGQNGYSYFLVETAAEQMNQSAHILEKTLSDYGFDITTTAEKLASFQAVENTYLSTFQTLGGLGLLLGTLGLGMILIRNVIERRGELATLRAFGFRRSTLALMVVVENGFLLLLGIMIGSISAIIAVAPHVLSSASQVPWLSLSLTLVVVFLIGMLASSAAVSIALRTPLLPALKAE